MPAYEYVCKACGKDFILFMAVKELDSKPEIKCTHCQSTDVTKKLTPFFAKTSKKS